LLGLGLAVLIMLLATGFRYKVLVSRILGFAVTGAVLYVLLFFFIPEWVGLAKNLPSSIRFGLSRREILWEGAWVMFQANPILGVGPLHYSAVWNHLGAHPHQAILQFLAEWGGVATGLLLFSILLGMWYGLNRVRTTSNYLDAALWVSLMASLVLAQVDGVFVMPYSEGWLAIIAGLATARWRGAVKVTAVAFFMRRTMFFILLLFAVVIVGRILIVDVPELHEASKGFYEKHNIGSPPRFWDQGWIPM
jgi:hypothetical protein